MIIKLSLALSSNRLQNLALPQPHQPQHSTLLAYGNLNGPLLLPSLPVSMSVDQVDGNTPNIPQMKRGKRGSVISGQKQPVQTLYEVGRKSVKAFKF